MICPAADPAGYTVQVDLTISAAGSPPEYAFSPTDPYDPAAKHLLNQKGDLDFSDSNQAVAVIMNLKDNSGLGLQFANDSNHLVFSFAKDYGGKKKPIKHGHFQFETVNVNSTGTVVSFCYRNTRFDDINYNARHLRSQYGIYLVDPNQNVSPIDPGVGNGGNRFGPGP
jgi:hypothetical protein